MHRRGLYGFFVESPGSPYLYWSRWKGAAGTGCALRVITTKGIRVFLMRSTAIAAAAAAAAIGLAACSGNSNDDHDMGAMTPSGAAQSTSAASSPGGAQTQAHNDADVAFVQGMNPHHQQAVEMSDMLLAKQGIDPRVVSMANDIKAAQGPEIEQMRGWLADWDVSTTSSSSPVSSMPGMPGHDMGNASGGMMSEQDMAALQTAEGVEASKLFLTQMAEHHRGAIAMAQTEAKSGQSRDAVTLAKSIVTSQQQEIDTMNQILVTL